jgi:hypothetical protein
VFEINESESCMARIRSGLRTVPSQQGARVSPQLPHERDESTDSEAVEPQPQMRQAAADVKRGLVDTEGRKDALQVFHRAGKNDEIKKKRPGRTRSR